MVVCNRCKKDPVETETNEALKAAPWGIVLATPPGSVLPEQRYCWRCTLALFKALTMVLDAAESATPPK